MSNFLSERVSLLTESGTIAMAKKSRELSEKGVDVINFTLGEPDFNTPDFIKKSAIDAINNNHSHYTAVGGINELKDAIIEKFKRDNYATYKRENIVVSTGAKHSLMNVLISIINEGDEVIILKPYWVSYKAMVEYNKGIPVFVEGDSNNLFKASAESIKKAITDKTKAILINSPSNPSGTVYNKEELDSIAKIVEENKNILLISDEIYEHINHVNKTPSFANYNSIKDRTIIINGLSKSFAMTGWRLGYLSAPSWLAKSVEKIQGQYTSGANSITQHAAVDALKSPVDKLDYMKNEFTKRRNLIVNLINEIDDIKLQTPEAAFYVFPNISKYFGKSYLDTVIKNSLDLAMFLLETGHVATVAGVEFGMDSHIRISYATSEDNIKEGVKRIKETLGKLS